MATLAGLLVLVGTAGFGVVTWKWLDAAAARDEADRQRVEAEGQRNIALSQQLAASARSELSVDPELSVLLAREAAGD